MLTTNKQDTEEPALIVQHPQSLGCSSFLLSPLSGAFPGQPQGVSEEGGSPGHRESSGIQQLMAMVCCQFQANASVWAQEAAMRPFPVAVMTRVQE